MPTQDLSPLTEIGWLASQPEALRTWAAGAGRWRSYEKGQLLYQAGDEPDALYGLAAGTLEIQIVQDGCEQITIHRAEPGFWIGESAILAKTTRSISVVAAAKARVFRIPAAAIRAVLGEMPQFWYSFFELSHINASRAVATLAEVFSQPPQARLARILLRLADADGRVHATQEDLSRLIGMRRSSLRRVLLDLVSAGAVTTGYRSIHITDRPRLQRLLAESRSPPP